MTRRPANRLATMSVKWMIDIGLEQGKAIGLACNLYPMASAAVVTYIIMLEYRA